MKGRDAMLQPIYQPVISRAVYDAVIFDLDGVITKTADVHARAWKALFDGYFAERHPDQPAFTIETDYMTYVDGKPRYDGVDSFLKSRGITLERGQPGDTPDMETVCGLGNRKNTAFLQELEDKGVERYETTIELIRALHARGIRTGIISSSKNCEHVLKAAGALDLFEVRIDGTHQEAEGFPGKPAPDIFLMAAEQMGVSPQRTVVVEDAQSGMQAGRAGDFALVLGVDRGGNRAALIKDGADLVVDDLGEVCVTDGLPDGIDQAQYIIDSLQGRKLAVFLDYDGTLTPIVATPDLAVMSDEMRARVAKLAEKTTVGIISGRDRQNVANMVKLDTMVYAGSHGFDIKGPGIEFEQGAEFIPALEESEAYLNETLGDIEGMLVERKKYAIAVHYRNVDADTHLPTIEAAVDKVVADHPRLRKKGGKMIFEIQPDLDWHKGKALLKLLEHLGYDESNCVGMYVGDDVTDEDAFRSLRHRGFGVVVWDGPRPTAANFSVGSVDACGRFLERLAELID